MFPPPGGGGVPPNATVAIALHNYQAQQPGDLSFESGDRIYVINQDPTGWWFGKLDDGRQGVFPYNRVQLQGNRPLPPPDMNDRINQVGVKPVEPFPRYGHLFEVQAVLSNGNQVGGKKTMKDFRVLNVALNGLTQTKGGIGPANGSPNGENDIPEWSDEFAMPNAVASRMVKERGQILGSYLQGAIGNNSKVDYLIVHWLNPNANFSLGAAEKQQVAGLLRSCADIVRGGAKPNPPQMAEAKYAWRAEDPKEINLVKGEVVAFVQSKEFDGWWIGTKINGGSGLFPYNYVRILKPEEAQNLIYPSSMPSPAMPTPKPFPSPAGGVMQTVNPIGIPDFGPTAETAKEEVYAPTDVKTLNKPTLEMKSSKPRPRRRVEKFGLECVEAFDELLTDGFTMEIDGKWVKQTPDRNCPQPGDTVTLAYSGYIWEPQKQQLLEFASSDPLVATNGSNISDGALVFTIGEEKAIDGVERAAARMRANQTVRVTLAPNMAYGQAGDPPDIPANAYLVYDLTLVKIDKGKGGGNATQNHGAHRAPVMFRDEDRQRGFMGGQSTRNAAEPVNNSLSRFAKSNRNIVNHGGQQLQSGVSADHFKRKLTLERLQAIVQNRQYAEYGIVPAAIEEYLTDDEFARAFNTTRQMFILMPNYKRSELKKKAGLF